MELLKWIGSVLLSIIGLCVAAAVGITVLAVGVSFGAVGLIGFVVIFLAAAIKDHFDTPSSNTKNRVR